MRVLASMRCHLASAFLRCCALGLLGSSPILCFEGSFDDLSSSSAEVGGARGHAGRPNILLLFPDQWRYDWDGFHTSPGGDIPLRVPTVKKLASQGVRFTQAYVPTPLCAPSRSALASGREYDRTGVPSNKYDYPVEQATFYSLLRAAGYHTMTVGKDDLTKNSQLGSKSGYPGCPQCRAGDGLYHQVALGFSDGLRYSGKEDVVKTLDPHEMYGLWLRNQTVVTERGTATNAWDAHFACMVWSRRHRCDKKTFTENLYEDNWTAENAMKLLRRRPRDRPFFLHVSFPGPHNPFLVTGPMRAQVSDGRVWPMATDGHKNVTPGGVCSPTGEPTKQNVRCNYAAEIENLDRLFQVLLDEVESQGELANTLIVVTSDHGEMLGDHDLKGKMKPWQGSVSVPLIVVGPGILKGAVVDRPVGTLDLAGTFLDFAGVSRAEQMTTVSMRSLLTTSQEIPYREFVSSGLDNFRVIIKEIGGISYKYVCCNGRCPGPPSTAPPVSASGWMEMLIDVRADPFDMHDLSTERPTIVEELRLLLPKEGYSGNFTAGCSTISHKPEELTKSSIFV